MYNKILVPIDGSETSTRGLKEAIKVAKHCSSRIRLVHVVNELIFDYSWGVTIYAGDVVEYLRKTGEQILEGAKASVRAEGIEPEGKLLESLGGSAAESITAAATEWSADLIVMGTHGRRGVRRLAMGSDAEHVLRTTPVPVLLVRAATGG